MNASPSLRLLLTGFTAFAGLAAAQAERPEPDDAFQLIEILDRGLYTPNPGNARSFDLDSIPTVDSILMDLEVNKAGIPDLRDYSGLEAIKLALDDAQEKPAENPAPKDPLREAWLGVSTEEVPPEVRAQLTLAPDTGLLVTSIALHSPAAKAGLNQYDVLVKLDDQILIHPRQLSVLVANNTDKNTVTLTWMRKGQVQTSTIVLETRLAKWKPEPVNPRFEINPDPNSPWYFLKDGRPWQDTGRWRGETHDLRKGLDRQQRFGDNARQLDETREEAPDATRLKGLKKE